MSKVIKIDIASDLASQLRASATQCRALDRSALLLAAADAMDALLADLLKLQKQYKQLRHKGPEPR